MTIVNARAAEAMDRRFDGTAADGILAALRPPREGWIRAIRTALGMSARQLGVRTGVSASAISQLERSELEGGISLGKLRSVADALGCDLVYGLVPRSSLEASVHEQARRRARLAVVETNQHMVLEGQGVDAEALERLIEGLANGFIGHRHLWDLPPGTPPER